MKTYLILKALVENSRYLPIAFFEDLLSISKRTVQSELSYLRKEGLNHGYIIRNSYGKGYLLEVKNEKSFNRFLKELSGEKNSEPDNGQVINDELSIILLRGDQYTSVSYIANELSLSKTFIYEKSKVISEYIASYGLKLERKSHFGLKIIGDPNNIRKLMLDLYMDEVKRFKNDVNLQTGNFDEYERIFEDVIHVNKLRIGYYEFQLLVAWLRIAIIYKRFFEDSDENLKINTEITKLVNVDKLLSKVELNFKIVLTDEEREEFGNLVAHSSQQTMHLDKLDNKKVKEQMRYFFVEMDQEDGTDYARDEEFLNNLSKHIIFLMDRLDQKITYKNPLLLELCIRYSMIFDIVLRFSKFIRENFGYEVSNDELGFIAIHFLNHSEKEKNESINKYKHIAIICTTGGGVSNLIKNKILTILPDAVIESFSFWEEDKLKKFQPNIIFTVVPLRNNFSVPIIYIRELLSDKDVDDIRQMLFLKKRSAHLKVPKEEDYLILLRESLFEIGGNESYRSIIKHMAINLIEKGFASNDFAKNVQLRENYMSTIYINGIAMPHPIEMNAKKSAIALQIVKPSLMEGGAKVKLIFMVCLAKKDINYYSAISNGLFKLMKDESMISRIYNEKNFFTIKDILKTGR